MRVLYLMFCLMFATPLWGMGLPDAGSPMAQLYADRCAACHSLPHPKRLDWPHWQHMLHVMKQRMDEAGMDMSTEDWQAIAAYLRQHAR